MNQQLPLSWYSSCIPHVLYESFIAFNILKIQFETMLTVLILDRFDFLFWWVRISINLFLIVFDEDRIVNIVHDEKFTYFIDRRFLYNNISFRTICATDDNILISENGRYIYRDRNYGNNVSFTPKNSEMSNLAIKFENY